MTGITLVGARNVSFTRTEEGHRNYTVVWIVNTALPSMGPAYILKFWPLHPVGTPYALSAVETDLWAYATPELNIAPHEDVTDGDPIQSWLVTQTYTTNPSWRCGVFPIENPLLEPWDIQLSYRHERQEATHYYQEQTDPDGDDGPLPRPPDLVKPLKMANNERLTGPQVEINTSKLTVELTANYFSIDVPLITGLLNRVNDTQMWGMPARTILFSDVRGQRLVYGTCVFYWRMTFMFDVDADTFDPDIWWWGTKVLKVGAPVGSENLDDYEIPKNKQTYEEMGAVPLQFEGRLATGLSINKQHHQVYRLYKGGNFALLGIPMGLTIGNTPPPQPAP